MKTQSMVLIVVLAACFPATSLAESGFFVSASLGAAELSEEFDGFDVDTGSTAFRLSAGWRFNRFLAVEGGYHKFGRFTQSIDVDGESNTIAFEADGFTIGGVASVPLSDRFSILFRGGAYFWDGDADINNVTAATPEDANPYFGAGVQYSLNDNLSLSADGSNYSLDGPSSTVLSIGLSYRF